MVATFPYQRSVDFVGQSYWFSSTPRDAMEEPAVVATPLQSLAEIDAALERALVSVAFEV